MRAHCWLKVIVRVTLLHTRTFSTSLLSSGSVPVPVHEIIPAKAQDAAFPFVDLLEDPVCPALWGLNQQDFSELQKTGFTMMWVTYWWHHIRTRQFMSVWLIKYSLTSASSTQRSHISARIMLLYCHHQRICILSMFELSQELVVHPCRTATFTWFSAYVYVQIDNCWAGGRWSYRINQLSLNLYLSRTTSHGIWQPRPLNSDLLLFWGPELWLCFLVYSFFAAFHDVGIHLPNRFLFIKLWGRAEILSSAPWFPVSGNFQCTLETSWVACTLLCCPPQISGGSNPHKD